MKKIVLFEPWHLGDVAVSLSVAKEYFNNKVEFSIICNDKWKAWILSTGLVKHVFGFTAPWTLRHRIDKYNVFNYNFSDFSRLRKEINEYSPDLIIDLRNDIRAITFLKILFKRNIRVISSGLKKNDNVYNRGIVLQNILRKNSSTQKVINFQLAQQKLKKSICLFWGASDFNRSMPLEKGLNLLEALHKKGYSINIIIQPGDDSEELRVFKAKKGYSNLFILQGSVEYIAGKIQESSLVVSTDSGWLHVAKFYERKTIGLFGFDTIDVWLPPGSRVVVSDTLYPASFRYKKRYHLLRPLNHIDIDKICEMVDESIKFS